ncbi:unnamed protein product [Diplocarpon coronariae]
MDSENLPWKHTFAVQAAGDCVARDCERAKTPFWIQEVRSSSRMRRAHTDSEPGYEARRPVTAAFVAGASTPRRWTSDPPAGCFPSVCRVKRIHFHAPLIPPAPERGVLPVLDDVPCYL